MTLLFRKQVSWEMDENSYFCLLWGHKQLDHSSKPDSILVGNVGDDFQHIFFAKNNYADAVTYIFFPQKG